MVFKKRGKSRYIHSKKPFYGRIGDTVDMKNKLKQVCCNSPVFTPAQNKTRTLKLT